MSYANVHSMPIHDLARFGIADALRERLADGADFRARDAYGWSPLMTAARHGQTECVQALAQAGADLEESFGGFVHPGYTPLMMAVDYAHSEAARVLCDMGASPLAQSRDGSCALSLSISRGGQPNPDPSLRAAIEAVALAWKDKEDLSEAIPAPASGSKRPRI